MARHHGEPEDARGAPEWSSRANAIWAKSSDVDVSAWLPLPQHLVDAAGVAGWLWDHWLPDRVKTIIESALPDEARDGRRLLAWLAGTHDVGKASPAFLCQRDDLADHARSQGLAISFDADRAKAPHATVSSIAIVDWLQRTYQTPVPIASTFADVAAGHHGRWPGPGDTLEVSARPTLIGGPEWTAVRDELISTMVSHTGVGNLLPHWLQSPLPVEVRMMLTGAVVVADWIASDESRFGYQVNAAVDDRVASALADLDLPPPWRPVQFGTVEQAMATRFPHLAGASPRSVQRICFELAQSQQGPCLMLVEAPMGGGKTEAALLAAEQLAAHSGAGGVFIGLPTMATSDAMFGRLLNWLETQQGRQSLSLAHGHAHLNADYERLREDMRLRSVEEDGPQAAVQGVAEANSWLFGRHRAMLANVVVGTIDQALRAGLLAKYVVLRHLAMAGKVIVIDEVHAADDYMREFLMTALRWLGKYGASVVLLSATLPAQQRAALIEAYTEGLGVDAGSSADSAAYPLVTMVGRQGASVHAVPFPGSGTEVVVEPIDDDVDTLVRELRPGVESGACIGVVRNTVARSQDTAAVLRDAFPGVEVLQIHARYLAAERLLREAHLRSQLGAPGPGVARPRGLIVVGTQVLEQSLDVDFDVMVSDLAPIDLLLQRIGRLHRHHRPGPRPAGAEDARLLLTGVTDRTSDVPEIDPGCEAVYGRSRLLRSWLTLQMPGRTTLRLPEDIRELVERGYGLGAFGTSSGTLQDALRDADEIHERAVTEAVGRARGLLMRVPRRSSGAPPQRLVDVRDSGGGGVRDGDDGIEVLVCYRDSGGLLRVMPGGHDLADHVLPGELGTPDWDQAKALARTSVKLPGAMCKPWAIDAVIWDLERDGLASWQLNPLLRGQLVLILDESHEATVGGFGLAYDQADGLKITRGAMA